MHVSVKKSQLQDSGQEAGGSNDTVKLEEQNLQPGKSPKKQRRAVKRFGEMSEEDVLKLKLPEHLDYNLDILFVSVLKLNTSSVIHCSATNEDNQFNRSI